MGYDKNLLQQKINQVVVNKKGYAARICNYRNNRDVDIMFEDGVILHNRTLQSFVLGKFAHPETLKELDLCGKRFGKLTVKNKVGNSGNRSYRWECVCDCGNIHYASTNNLKFGYVKSCGCMHRGTKIVSNQRTHINHIMASYKNAAKKRNLVWELTRTEFENLIFQPCYYCGVTGFNTHKEINQLGETTIHYNGIDRLDSGVGYIFNNVVPCCKLCNQAKNSLTKDEFFDWVKRVCEHSKIA